MPKKVLTVMEFASMGGKARAKQYNSKTLSEWAGRGGKARAEKYSAAQLRKMAANAGRPAYKLTPAVETQIVKMLGQGKLQKEISEQFGVSLRTIGRIAAKAREALG